MQSVVVYRIIYKSLFVLDNNQVRYFQVNIREDDDVQTMFRTNEHFGFNKIELYVILQQH